MTRRCLTVLAAFTLIGSVTFAHGDAEHVRGTVTSIADSVITVQTAEKQPRTIAINSKTMLMRGKTHLTIKDVKVGERVVIDVDKKTSIATEIKVGATAAPTKAVAEPKRKP